MKLTARSEEFTILEIYGGTKDLTSGLLMNYAASPIKLLRSLQDIPIFFMASRKADAHNENREKKSKIAPPMAPKDNRAWSDTALCNAGLPD